MSPKRLMRDRAERDGAPFPRWMVWALGGLTLLVFGIGGALLINLVQGRDLHAVVLGPWHWTEQAALGTGAGLVIGFAARALVRTPWMREVDERFARRIGARVCTATDAVFLSVCAGVGEELFFRGALQHWLGIVSTAVLFVAIHGYLDPRERRMLAYGGLLTVGMVGIGAVAEHTGLLAAMIAHTVIDLVLFDQLRRTAMRSRAAAPGQRPGYL